MHRNRSRQTSKTNDDLDTLGAIVTPGWNGTNRHDRTSRDDARICTKVPAPSPAAFDALTVHHRGETAPAALSAAQPSTGAVSRPGPFVVDLVHSQNITGPLPGVHNDSRPPSLAAGRRAPRSALSAIPDGVVAAPCRAAAAAEADGPR